MPRIHYNVPMVQQRRSPVCWLACAVMLEQFKRRRTSDVNEIGYIEGDFRMSSIPNLPSRSGLDSLVRLIRGQDISNQSFITPFLRRRGFRLKRSSQLRISRRQRRPTMNTGPSMRRNNTNSHQRSISESIVVEKLTILLQNYGPFILFHHCGAFSYGNTVNTPNNGAHAVLITGIDTRSNVFYFNNPWGQSNVRTSVQSIVAAVIRWEDSKPGASVAYF